MKHTKVLLLSYFVRHMMIPRVCTCQASALANTCENAVAIACHEACTMACMPSPALVKRATKSELLQRHGRLTEGTIGQGQREFHTAQPGKRARSQDTQEGTARRMEVTYTLEDEGRKCGG